MLGVTLFDPPIKIYSFWEYSAAAESSSGLNGNDGHGGGGGLGGGKLVVTLGPALVAGRGRGRGRLGAQPPADVEDDEDAEEG